MPYQRISWAHIADPKLKAIIHRSDLLLGDVYTMCCKHPLKRTNAGGCQFAVALVLLCIIDALAGCVYPASNFSHKKGVQEKRFKKLIREKVHWASGGMKVAQAASILWKEYRNPLTHAAGLDEKAQHKHAGLDEPVVGIWGDVKPQRIGNVDRRKTWPDSWPILSPDRGVLRTATGKPARLKLTGVALYWAVKHLVRDLAK
jgi:hypothetical protein